MQRDRIATMDAMLLDKYAAQNLDQVISESDPFPLERYIQFHRFLPKHARTILNVGANTGRGGQQLVDLEPNHELTALDCVQSRLDVLPKCYRAAICGLLTLCELQRVLKLRGRLLMTTPNPGYLRLWLSGGTVYTVSHLTQHWPAVKARV
jgi:hypothetical protein